MIYSCNLKMNIDHLKRDELEVECLVRNLTVDDITYLKKHTELKEISPVLVPIRPHLSAFKNPKRELQLCGVKLNSVK